MVCTVFPSASGLFFIHLTEYFSVQTFFNSDEVKLVHFSFYGSCFWCRVQEPPSALDHKDFPLSFLTKHADASHWSLWFLYKVWGLCKSPHGTRFPLAPFTEQAVLSPWITFVPFSKVGWACLYGSVSELPVCCVTSDPPACTTVLAVVCYSQVNPERKWTDLSQLSFLFTVA